MLSLLVLKYNFWRQEFWRPKMKTLGGQLAAAFFQKVEHFPCVALCSPVLPCVSLYHSVLPRVTLCYPVPLCYCVTLCYSVLPCVTLCYPVLLYVPLCYLVLPCVTLCYHLLPCVTMCYPVLLCVTLCYLVLPCNNNNNDRLFNLFAALTQLQGGSLSTYKYFGIMTRRYNC